MSNKDSNRQKAWQEEYSEQTRILGIRGTTWLVILYYVWFAIFGLTLMRQELMPPLLKYIMLFVGFGPGLNYVVIDVQSRQAGGDQL